MEAIGRVLARALGEKGDIILWGLHVEHAMEITFLTIAWLLSSCPETAVCQMTSPWHTLRALVDATAAVVNHNLAVQWADGQTDQAYMNEIRKVIGVLKGDPTRIISG